MKNRNPRRLQASLSVLGALVLTAVPVLTGCDSGTGTAARECPPVINVQDLPPPNSDVRPILFDSFGVALDAELIGDRESTPAGDGSTLWAFSGTGQSPLLGEIQVTQQHLVDLSSNEITDGTFTYESKSGDFVSGTYAGIRTPTEDGYTMALQAKITGGHVGCTPPDPEVGRGTLSGSVTSDGFDYQLDGWLFHHGEEIENP